jgi:hypothetical protein
MEERNLLRKHFVVDCGAHVGAVDVGRGVAFAKIAEQRTNPAGNEAQGQGKLVTVTNVYPAGKAPAWQNK